MVLTGSDTYSGPTTISAGTLQLGAAARRDRSAAPATSPTTASWPSIVRTTFLSRRPSAAAAAWLNWAPASLTLSGSNTYTGGTTISSGTLQFGDGVSNNGPITTGAIADNATLIFADSLAQTYSGVISGSGNVIQMSPGLLQLSGSNTYSGLTQISGGTLQVTHAIIPALSSPLVHYAMDGPLGAIAAGAKVPDSSGNGCNGTMAGGGAGLCRRGRSARRSK